MQTASLAAPLAAPAAPAQPPFPYNRALDVWARYEGGEISFGHALHDIVNAHVGILNATKAKDETDAHAAARRTVLLGEFLPAAEGPALFEKFLQAQQAEQDRLTQQFPHSRLPYENIKKMGMICLPEDQWTSVYTVVRDAILEQNQCARGQGAVTKNFFPFAAGAAILHTARELFSPGERALEIAREDMEYLFDLSVTRSEQMPDNEPVLDQSLHMAALHADTYGLFGLSNEHVHVSSVAVESRRCAPRLSVAFLKAFNGNGKGPVMIINGDADYMAVHLDKAGNGKLAFQPEVAAHTQAFVAEVQGRSAQTGMPRLAALEAG